jgi:nicotinate-nucleotide pyrophosphorylase
MRAALIIGLITLAMLPGIAVGDVMTAAKRARSGAFDTTGVVGCAQEVGQSLETCAAAVAHADDSAAVVVTFLNGFSRTLLFAEREFLRGNATMSGVGTDTEWSVSNGMYQIRVDDQRFDIPEALVWGE